MEATSKKAAPTSAAAALSLADAQLAGLIDVFRFPKQTTIVTDTVRPVSFQLPSGTFRLVVTPVRDGVKETSVVYGPLNGAISISADTGVTVSLNGVVVSPGASDTIAPATNAAVSPTPSSGWNNSDVMVTLTAADNAGGSGVRRITYSASGAQTILSTQVNGSSVSFPVTASGTTTVSFFAEDNAGNLETAKLLTVKIDRTAPAITCVSPSGQWAATNVTIACTATDSGGSGLLNPADGSFVLTTSVPDGSENGNAQTGSRSVCDVAGNCSTAGPIGGNKVDRKPPAITITTPGSSTYLLNQSLAVNYQCSDGGSGVATCTGSAASGKNLDTGSVGKKSFSVNATDNVSNASTQSVSYTVTYNVCLQYDPATASPPGAVVPIRLKLCDATNANVGTPGIVVTATGINPPGVLQSPGANNPGGVFRFMNEGGYEFLLDTTGYSPGNYMLNFLVTGDPAPHQAPFQLK